MCCPCLITFTNEFLVVVVFSCQVLSNFLQPYWLQHTRLPCPLLSTRVSSNTYPLSQWCYLTISSSATLFSFCLQSFPTSGSFPMSRLSAFSEIWGGQTIGTSALASVLPMNIQSWLPLALTGLISWQSKGLSRVFSSTMIQNINSSVLSILHGPALTSVYDYR